MTSIDRENIRDALFFPNPIFDDEDLVQCRGCGCHDCDACVDDETGMVCGWVEEDLCSSCAARLAAEADPAMAGLYAEDGQ